MDAVVHKSSCRLRLILILITTNMSRVQINSITIDPPLINSSCAWASSVEQLRALHQSKYTGAVTIRTSTIEGFAEDSSHKVAFSKDGQYSINSYGYSPHPLSQYLEWIKVLYSENRNTKPFIISIPTCDTGAYKQLISTIQDFRISHQDIHIAIEINASCPNIPGHPPPAYNFVEMAPLLAVAHEFRQKDPSLTVGLKLPPYVYRAQFEAAVLGITEDVHFITCSNTLGNGLLFADQTADGMVEASEYALGPSGATGGLAGPAVHALALGNVYTFATVLREYNKGTVRIIGVGGVYDEDGVRRMRRAGAAVVGVATALGKGGPEVFEALHRGL